MTSVRTVIALLVVLPCLSCFGKVAPAVGPEEPEPVPASCPLFRATGTAIDSANLDTDGPCRAYVVDAPDAYGVPGRVRQSNADDGEARVADSTLTVECFGDRGTTLDVQVACFAGRGRYVVGAGRVRYLGQGSDAPCRLDVDVSDAEVRGIFACGNSVSLDVIVFDDPSLPVRYGAFRVPLR